MFRSTRYAFAQSLAVAGIALGSGSPQRSSHVADTSPLVSVAWLANHLHDADVVLLSVSSADVYAREHIPGSQFVDNGALEASEMSGGGSMDMSALPREAELKAKLEHLGISDASHVVVVFNGNGITQATRVLFLLSYAGLEHTSLLDGGVNAWRSAGRPLTREVPTVSSGRLTAHVHPDVATDYAGVQARQHLSHERIVDARTPAYYGGPVQASMSMAAGHIPGAVNVPYNTLFDENQLFLAPDLLRERFRAAGAQPGDTIIAYCHVGYQATVVVLGARILGYPVRMYAGSFHDWSARKLPTEGGAP